MERAKQFINKIKNNYPNKNILIVSHAGLIKALHFNLIGYGENTDFLYRSYSSIITSSNRPSLLMTYRRVSSNWGLVASFER